MTHEYKAFPAVTLKVEQEQGIVEAIVAVMGNVDLGDDRIWPGAFKKTLAERGLKIKVLDQHNTASVLDVLGRPLAIKEVGREELPQELLAKYPEATGGLWTRTQYNLKTQAGHDAFQHIAAGDVDEYSFAYDTVKGQVDFTKENNRTIRNLKELILHEYSPVIFGMNPATATVSAKEQAAEPDAKAVNLSQRVRKIENAFSEAYNTPNSSLDYWVREVYDEYVIVCCYHARGPAEFYQAAYTYTEEQIEFAPRAEWLAGEYVFVPLAGGDGETAEAKAGRVIAARNAQRISSALAALTEVLKDAGLGEPAGDDEATDDDGSKAGPGATPPTSDDGAGPGATPPTEAELLDLELSLLNLAEV